MAVRWEHFEHVADIGIRGFGATAAEAFAGAAIALTAVITDPASVRQTRKVHLVCDAPDIEMLLSDFLNSLLFEMSTRKMLFSKFNVNIDGTELAADCYGELVDLERHKPAVEVKAATFSELKVKQQQDETWLAQCVVDV
jgi:SHS2 domain-containing protein